MAIFTVLGIGLFAYLVYSNGFGDIFDGIVRFGLIGFATILFLYFLRICTRAYAFKLSVGEPYCLSMTDTVPAVVIGEAMGSTIPMGILISGTSKAVAVRNRIPLVAGLSSVATENLFYSLVTGIYLIVGAVLMLRISSSDEGIVLTLNVMIVTLLILITLGILMVIRQWHLASELCELAFRHGFFKKILNNGRLHVRLFENLIYGFYRRHPRRFIPICSLEVIYHLLGVVEVLFILSRLTDTSPSLTSAFLLESISRLITIIFKLIPFSLGVDEAGAQFVGEAIALTAGVGVTLAIIRKGRILFWTSIGWILIGKRGLTFRSVSNPNAD